MNAWVSENPEYQSAWDVALSGDPLSQFDLGIPVLQDQQRLDFSQYGKVEVGLGMGLVDSELAIPVA
jgi:hypothetical protein